MLDPITIKLAFEGMRAAYKGIQYCCEALGEGKVEVQRIKKGIDDAKAIVKETKGIWQAIRGLFSKPAPTVSPQPIAQPEAAKPAAKKAKRAEYTEHVPDEDEVVQQFIDHLSNWFRNHAVLCAHLEQMSAEVYSKDIIDPVEVLKLTTMQAEVDGAHLKLSEMMRVQAPRQLGPLWERFQAMQEKIKREQSIRRERERIWRQREASRRYNEEMQRLERNLSIGFSLLALVYFWWLMWAIWQNSLATNF